MFSRRVLSRTAALLPVAFMPATLGASPEAEAQEIDRMVAHTVGEQLAGAFMAESPFTPDAPDHLWFDAGD